MTGDPQDRQKLRKVVEQFKEAWQSGTAPLVETFLPRKTGSGPSVARQELLEELVELEMEYRWRGGRRLKAGRPKLEEYLERFPELGGPDHVSIALIGAEYRIRHLYGDRPAFEEYPGRFRGRSADIRAIFAKMDLAISASLLAESQPGAPPARPAPPPAAFALQTVAGLLEALRTNHLLEMSKMNELIAADLQGRLGDIRTAARKLITDDWLTPYQVNLILQGRASELVMGSYLILGRLGQSITGQIYKALHRTMQRVVALKVIRQELLADREAVERFYREMGVVGRLDHPNIIHAYDAGPIGDSHVLAMEFFEGMTLAQMVEKSGHLPPAQACDYIRQVANGLQHAHEKGLVHRDIKPQNLVVDRRPDAQHRVDSVFGTVKILDMGLARLQSGMGDDWSSLVSAKRGVAIVGTGDYLAPEQAMDYHAVDIRADIYSLGCVLYFLLTGRPPFPDGTIAQKLLKHQQAIPAKVSLYRRDVPPQVDTVLSKMMGKRPEYRYATPADVANALAALRLSALHPPK
jgi:tRNA A-37 threonylcarbamoyl transferase component Bud32